MYVDDKRSVGRREERWARLTREDNERCGMGGVCVCGREVFLRGCGGWEREGRRRRKKKSGEDDLGEDKM